MSIGSIFRTDQPEAKLRFEDREARSRSAAHSAPRSPCWRSNRLPFVFLLATSFAASGHAPAKT